MSDMITELSGSKPPEVVAVKLIKTLLAADKTPEARAKMLGDIYQSNLDEPELLHGVLTALFCQMGDQAVAAQAEKLKQKYELALTEMKKGPVRPATYVGPVDLGVPGVSVRVEVVAPDGQRRYPTLAEDVKAEQLKPGADVFLDPEGAVVLAASQHFPEVGQEARFLRQMPNPGLVELELREERFVLSAAQPLLDAIAAGQVRRGDRVMFSPTREFAFQHVPVDSDRKHRFVDQSGIPDLVISRDIGQPHWSLGWLIRRADILLNRPDLLERFDVRPRVGVLMVGPTGTGKTLSIRGFLSEFQKMLRKRTGRMDLGSRVIRIKTSELLSPWFGETDQKMDALFDDVAAAGRTDVITAAGEKIRPPVVLIFEECEALGRRRGMDEGNAVYDRVIGTLLQRLDDPTNDLAGIPLIIIASSNRPDMLDGAMWRRLANVVARFERLERQGFVAVLNKKIKASYPLVSLNGHPHDAVRSRLIDEVTSAMYSNIDGGALVEITLRDGSKVEKRPCHFLTGAIVEQAVSEVIDRVTFEAAESGDQAVGLSAMAVLDALFRQVSNVADNLTPQNVGEYVVLPSNARVADVRRLRLANRLHGTMVADAH
jgi:hypothetical protein